MHADQKTYRNELVRRMDQSHGELRLMLEREIDRVDRMTWSELCTCTKCGEEKITLGRLKKSPRTTVCVECVTGPQPYSTARIIAHA